MKRILNILALATLGLSIGLTSPTPFPVSAESIRKSIARFVRWRIKRLQSARANRFFDVFRLCRLAVSAVSSAVRQVVFHYGLSPPVDSAVPVVSIPRSGFAACRVYYRSLRRFYEIIQILLDRRSSDNSHSLSGQAATLSGQVKDESNNPGGPYPGRRSRFSARGTRPTCLCNYRLENIPTGNYAVEIRRVGYPPETRQADLSKGDVTLNVGLSGSPLTLAPITITAAPAAKAP